MSKSPIPMSGFVTFLGVSVMVIVTPGQDTLLTVRNTLSGGRAGGVATAIGVVSGQFLWTIAAAIGVATLLAAYPAAYVVLRALGAAYLVFLGCQSLSIAIRGKHPRMSPTTAAIREPASALTFTAQGLLSNLGNPKSLLFFTSLLPQFAAEGGSGLVGLGLVYCLITLGWLSVYAWAVDRVGDRFARGRLAIALEGAAGIALLLFGVAVAAEAVS
jgi:threonine/homoserine/homoserine lactone efflux protein